eukprot:1139731-Pelagomonas_calceolata.AAC.5
MMPLLPGSRQESASDPPHAQPVTLLSAHTLLQDMDADTSACLQYWPDKVGHHRVDYNSFTRSLLTLDCLDAVSKNSGARCGYAPESAAVLSHEDFI